MSIETPFSEQITLHLKNKTMMVPSTVLRNSCRYNFEPDTKLENITFEQMNMFLNFLINQEIFLKQNNNFDKIKMGRDIVYVADILKYNNYKIRIIINFMKNRFDIKDNTFVEDWMIELAEKFVKEKYLIKNNYLKIKKFMELTEIDLYELKNPIKSWKDLRQFFDSYKENIELKDSQNKIVERFNFLKYHRLKCENCDSEISLANRKKCIVCKSKLMDTNLIKI